MPRLDAIDKGVGTGKSLFALLRDLAILLVIVLLIAAPDFMKARLSKAGFVSAKLLEFEWRSEAKQTNLEIDTRVQNAAEHANAAAEELEKIRQSDPQLYERLKTIRDNVAGVRAGLGLASNQLAATVVQQQKALDRVSAAPTPLRGWVSTHNNVVERQGPFAPGTRLMVRERNLRVRETAGVNSKVLGILPANSEAEIVATGKEPWAEIIQR